MPVQCERLQGSDTSGCKDHRDRASAAACQRCTASRVKWRNSAQKRCCGRQIEHDFCKWSDISIIFKYILQISSLILYYIISYRGLTSECPRVKGDRLGAAEVVPDGRRRQALSNSLRVFGSTLRRLLTILIMYLCMYICMYIYIYIYICVGVWRGVPDLGAQGIHPSTRNAQPRIAVSSS